MKHKVKVLSKEEVLANRSSAYEFIDFDKQETLKEAALDYFLSTSSIIVKDIKDYDEPQAIRLLEECGFEKQEEMYSKEELKKVLTEIILINPSHLSLLRSGYGEFPDSYELTENGVNYIIEQFKKK